MFNKELLNDVAKWGLILGLVMSLSRILEYNMLLSGDVVKFSLLVLEWPLAAGIYFYIILRANKRRIAILPKWVAYPVGVAINYSMMISIFAAVLVGISSHLFVMSELGGYDVLTERMLVSMESVMSEVDMPEESMETYNQLLGNAESAMSDPESLQSPTIFSSIFTMASNYIISGFVIGLIVGLFVKRRAEVADVINEDDDKDEKEA